MNVYLFIVLRVKPIIRLHFVCWMEKVLNGALFHHNVDLMFNSES